MMADRYTPVGQSTSSDTSNLKRKEVAAKVPKTENILFVGAENWYKNFWLKMMFVSAAYVMAKDAGRFRKADKYTLAYVDRDYTHDEKVKIQFLHDTMGYAIRALRSSDDLVGCMNEDRDNYKLQDVAFFCHGEPGRIALNYWNSTAVDLNLGNYSQVRSNAFLSSGRLFSFACRTGVYKRDEHFDSEAEAQPEQSLAQKMATHFGIEVHAFLRRSLYSEVLRTKSDSQHISETLKEARKTQEGRVIPIPPEHEALPHDGLADSWIPLTAPKREGTVGYALWRKAGGIGLPCSGEKPTGLPQGMRIFKPVQAKP